MKKFLSLFLCIIITLSLCGCDEQKIYINNADFTGINYNNYLNSYNEFCAFNDTVFYPEYDSFYSYTKVYRNGISERLLSDKDFPNEAYQSEIYVVKDKGYFISYPLDEEDIPNYDITIFYEYDIPSGAFKKIHSVKGINTWLAGEGYLAYTKYYDSQDGLSALYVYDINASRETIVSKEIEAFSIVNNNLRYVINDDSTKLYEYDMTSDISAELASFNCYSNKEVVEYNFTSDKLIMQPTEKNYYEDIGEVSVYYINSGLISTLTLPKEFCSIIAADNYAYAVCINYEEELSFFDSPSFTSGIYKIDLNTGKYKKVEDTAEFSTSIYVESDEKIYIFKCEEKFIFPFETTVISLNTETGEKNELFSFTE